MSDEPINELLDSAYSQSGTITFLDGPSSPETYTVTKSNKLIGAQIRLNSREQKVLAACISLINPQGEYPNGLTVELDDEHIQTLTGIEKRHIYRFIDKAARSFHSIPIETPGKREGTVDIINIAHRSQYDPETRKFKITFHEDMHDELLKLSQYTSVELQYLVILSSKYSIRLYEMLSKQYNQKKGGIQYFKTTLDALYFPLGLKDLNGKPLTASYIKDYTSFKRRVLDPACKEISSNTNLVVSFEPYRVGRSIAGITFVIRPKSKIIEKSFILPDHYDKLIIEDALKFLNIKQAIHDKWIKLFDEQVIKSNIFYCARKVVEGADIKNPTAYTQLLLKQNIANLPDIANPFSDKYKHNKDGKEFVKRVVLPIWWMLPAELRFELSKVSGFSVHPKTASFYKGFITSAKNDSYDEAEVLFDSDSALDEWSNN